MSKWTKQQMANEVLELIENKSVINLGIGLPTLVAEMAKEDKELVIHSENGVLGVNGRPSKKDVSPTLINAGKETVSVAPGASFFDSSLSFGMIRGGHIDVTVLGAMEVDVHGSLANWSIPGKKITGMGGAMDLVNGPKTVIAMMYHYNRDGISKLVRSCTLPLTGKNVVHFVVTDYGVFKSNPRKEKFEIIKLSDGADKKFLQDNLYVRNA